jgi:glycerol uptake facilitator-like aquaporin
MGFDFKEMSGLTEIMKDRNIWKALLAEFLGTLILVFVGCGSCINWGGGSAPTTVQISLAFGITVATMAQVSRSFTSYYLIKIAYFLRFPL